MSAARVYKLCSASAWSQACMAGAYIGSADDLRDGYVHLSSAAQVARTAVKYFAGQPDLLLVAFAASGFGLALRWEPSRGGQLFPHVYGTIDPASALWLHPLALGADGRHVWPAAIMADPAWPREQA